MLWIFFSYVGEMLEIEKFKKFIDKNVRGKNHTRIKIECITFNLIEKNLFIKKMKRLQRKYAKKKI